MMLEAVEAHLIKKNDCVFLRKEPYLINKNVLSTKHYKYPRKCMIYGTHVFDGTNTQAIFHDHTLISRFLPKEETLKLIRVEKDQFHTVNEKGQERELPVLCKEIYNKITLYSCVNMPKDAQITLTVKTIPVLDSDDVVSQVTSWDIVKLD